MKGFRLPPQGAIVLAILLLAPRGALAYCGDWDAALSGSPSTGHESKALYLDWTDSGPGMCANPAPGVNDDWPGADHFQLHVAWDSTIAPASPSGATYVGSFTSTSEFTHFVHRSAMNFAYAVFACASSSGCTRWYGQNGAENPLNETAATGTDAEEWELVGITAEDVTGHAAVPPGEPVPNAPHVFVYPSGWDYSPDTMAIFWSTDAYSSPPSIVWYQERAASGWADSDDFNDWGDATGDGGWSDPVAVAAGSTVYADADYNADHPWAMLTDDGDPHVELFVQSQRDTGVDQILQLQSAGAAGDDFGRDCSGSSCTYTVLEAGAYGAAGYIAVPAGTGSGELHDDMHSRIVWNYIQNPVVNLGETPDMYFQMAHAAYGSCSGSGASDDIGWAVGTYDTGADEWGWTPQLDGSGCYEEIVTDGHDNSTVPLPWGEYKMYYKDYDVPSYFHILNWDGSTWGDLRDIDFYWDGSTTAGPDHECIDNVSAVVWIDPADPGNPLEGMFFKIVDSDECGYVGLDDDGTPTVDDSAIVFARLRN